MWYYKVLTAIDIMERAGKVDMHNWQGRQDGSRAFNGQIKSNEKEHHACGNTGCLAGYIAISPEFKKDGGYVDFGLDGAPSIMGDAGYRRTGAGAIAEWMGIGRFNSDALCGLGESWLFYGCSTTNITKEMVLAKLYALRDWGEDSEQFMAKVA